MYKLALHNVRLIDPENGVDKILNMAFEHGQVAEVTESSLAPRCDTLLDFDGLLAVPGIVDVHTHTTAIFGGSLGGFRMLAKAGICTAMDLAGPADETFANIKRHGAGLNVAVLEAVRPGGNLSCESPSATELETAISNALQQGALGCKLLGGHFPLTPEASAAFVKEAGRQCAYASWHAGTTQNGNTLDSLRDVLELSSGHKLHVAHINTYCRGITADPASEALCAIAMLTAHPHVHSEAYLAETNGTTFSCNEHGHMASKATAQSLTRAGYEDSRQGLISAVRDGFAHVFAPKGLETGIYYGDEAIKLILDAGDDLTGGFNVNPAESRLLLCLAKRPDKTFVVDAIASDGGSLPRNVLVSHGMALVNTGMLSLADFVRKTSVNPSRMLGLHGKGHLNVGADADVTVIDPRTCTPVATIVGGEVCMFKGFVSGSGGTLITTEKGLNGVKRYNMPVHLVNPEDFLPGHIH